MRPNILKYICACFIIACFSIFPPGRLYGYGEQSSASTGLSRAFNPTIGANFLFLGSYSDRNSFNDDPFESGLHIQEIEFSLMAIVDPYLRAQLTLSIPGTEGIEVEEGYVKSTYLPSGWAFQVGKFKFPFGKQNRLHTHAYPFIDAPWINTMLLGEEGLNEVGVQLNYLTPLPWFSEVSAVVFDPSGESPFIQRKPHEMGYLSNWRNLWDINSQTTFELGISGATAKTSWEEMTRLSSPPGLQNELSEDGQIRVGDLYLFNTDATVKHVSTGGVYHSWDVSVEYTQGMGVFDRSVRAQYGGVTGYGRFQLRRRWWVEGRGDVLGLPIKVPEPNVGEVLDEGDTPWRISGMVALVPSEFTAVRLQYDYADRIISDPENRVMLQLNVTFGAHPAHSY